jgi:transcriptional regulator with XRE-family HTH domain
VDAASLIKDARRRAGLSQAQLAGRLGISQAAVAKLEHSGVNPTIKTLDKALRATGHRLELNAPAWRPAVDESLIRQQLALSPDERMRQLEYQTRKEKTLAIASQLRDEHYESNRSTENRQTPAPPSAQAE